MFKKCFACLLPSSCFPGPPPRFSLSPGFYTGEVLELFPNSLKVRLTSSYKSESPCICEVGRPMKGSAKVGARVFVLRQEAREIVTIADGVEKGEERCEVLCVRSSYIVLADDARTGTYVFPFQYMYPDDPETPPQHATLLRLSSPPYFQILLTAPPPPTTLLSSPGPKGSSKHLPGLSQTELLAGSSPKKGLDESSLLKTGGWTREETQFRSFISLDEGDNVMISNLALPDCDTPCPDDSPLRYLSSQKFSPVLTSSLTSTSMSLQPLSHLSQFGVPLPEISLLTPYAKSWRYCGEGRNSLFVCGLVWWLEAVSRSGSELELLRCKAAIADCAQEEIQPAIGTILTLLDAINTGFKQGEIKERVETVQVELRKSQVLEAIYICARGVFHSGLDHLDGLIETNQSVSNLEDEQDLDYALLMKTLKVNLSILRVTKGQMDTIEYDISSSDQALLLYQRDTSFVLLYQNPPSTL